MSNHTPGPWEVCEGDLFYVIDENETIIADTLQYVEKGRERANAQLIAAAPDMLAVLEEILPDIECHCGEAYTGRGIHESNSLCHHAETVKTAIAKATGKEAQ